MDKYSLAKKVIRLKNWCYTESGYPEGTPPFLSVWLYIIIDNVFHMLMNYGFIEFF